MGEHEGDVGLHVGGDLGVIDLGGGLVGREVHDDVGPLADVRDGVDDEAGFAGALGVGGVGAEAYADVNAGVLEVEGVGVALRAVADDGDFLCLDEREVCVCVVVCLCHFVLLPLTVMVTSRDQSARRILGFDARPRGIEFDWIAPIGAQIDATLDWLR